MGYVWYVLQAAHLHSAAARPQGYTQLGYRLRGEAAGMQWLRPARMSMSDMYDTLVHTRVYTRMVCSRMVQVGHKDGRVAVL